ncbi:MAG: DNA-processing protein DprA [Methanothrix sp.]|nr:DNA-processing protein DprA [Methanothrix sp.]
MDDELDYLAFINDQGYLKGRKLTPFISHLKSIGDFFNSLKNTNEIALNNDKNIPKELVPIIELYSKMDFEKYRSEIERLIASGVDIIPFYSNNYPIKLKDITNPPIVIYYKGKWIDFDKCIAIVGTRNLSHHGHKNARAISSALAKKGYTIVSGLARGTDTEAHCGALDVSGKTIAVLAGHIEDIFPRENEKLANDIQKSGAIISEISTMKQVHKGRFIERNRLISGISECLIVIEMNGRGGGTLQQVNWAIKQGKAVFILKPLERDNDAIQGFMECIKLGAMPLESDKDVLNYLKTRSRFLTLDHFQQRNLLE